MSVFLNTLPSRLHCLPENDMKGLILVCALCLLVSGCASWEIHDGFVAYEGTDHVGDFIGKSVGNVVIAAGYAMYFTAYVAAQCVCCWAGATH